MIAVAGRVRCGRAALGHAEGDCRGAGRLNGRAGEADGQVWAV